jgi:hypothetical protein
VGEHHAGQLMPAFEFPGAVIAVVGVDDALEFIAGNQTQELAEHIGCSWHGGAPDTVTARKRLTVSENHRDGMLSGKSRVQMAPKSLIYRFENFNLKNRNADFMSLFQSVIAVPEILTGQQ